MKYHVDYDVVSDSTYIPVENVKSQTYLNNLNEWTEAQKMKINEGKTKQMSFNFTDNYQFSTRTSINNKNIEVLEKIKLLGVGITNNLKLEENTSLLVKKKQT